MEQAMPSRKRFVRGFAFVGAMAILTAGCTFSWAALRGGADRTGFSQENDTGSLSTANVTSVHAVFSVPIPGISDNVQFNDANAQNEQTPPAVAANASFVTGVFVNGIDGYLHAFDLGGHARWRVATTGQPTDLAPTPAMSGNAVIVAFGTPGGSTLAAYNAPNGTLLWSHALAESISARAGAPAVDGNMVYVANGERVSQFNVNGTFVRDYTTAQTPITAPVAVANGALFIGTQAGGLLAENIVNGTEMWRYGCADPDGCNETDGVAVSGSSVVMSRHNGHVKMLSTGTDGVNAGGIVIWVAQNPATDNPDIDRVQPVIAYGKVYLATQSGALTALDLNTGAQVWRTPVVWRPKALAVSNGVLFSTDPLRAYDAGTGAPLAKILKTPIGLDFEGAAAQGTDVVIADHAIWQINADGTLWKFGIGS